MDRLLALVRPVASMAADGAASPGAGTPVGEDASPAVASVVPDVEDFAGDEPARAQGSVQVIGPIYRLTYAISP